MRWHLSSRSIWNVVEDALTTRSGRAVIVVGGGTNLYQSRIHARVIQGLLACIAMTENHALRFDVAERRVTSGQIK